MPRDMQERRHCYKDLKTRKIKWFGPTFTSHDVTEDQDKINAIVAEGRPENTEDVRSFSTVFQYNSKFVIISLNIDKTYEEVRFPFRALLKRVIR